MTTHEAAAIASVTPTTIRNWIAKGRLTAGTKTLEHAPWCIWDITEEALAAAVAAQRRPGRPYKTAPKAQTAEAQTVEESKPC
jgi:DNA-binding LytR/AlgR family response regulator